MAAPERFAESQILFPCTAGACPKMGLVERWEGIGSDPSR
jgi:hypothetical protein